MRDLVRLRNLKKYRRKKFTKALKLNPQNAQSFDLSMTHKNGASSRLEFFISKRGARTISSKEIEKLNEDYSMRLKRFSELSLDLSITLGYSCAYM